MCEILLNVLKNRYGYENFWKIIETYFKNKHLTRLVRHQIESYNYFIGNQIHETIKMLNYKNCF